MELTECGMRNCPQNVPLSLSKTYALKYWWCSPPRTGIASVRPTVWMVRGDRRVLVQRGRRTRRIAMAIARHSSHSELSPRTLLRRHRRPAGLYRAAGIAAYAAARGLRGPRARPDRG